MAYSNSIVAGGNIISSYVSEKVYKRSNAHVRKRMRFTYTTGQKALNMFVCWLLLRKEITKVVHFVFTIPEGSFNGDESFYAKKFKYTLERLRLLNMLGEYSWFKERQANGVIHYHFVHDGYISFKKVNAIWVRAIGVKSLNAVRSRKGHYKVKNTDFARYFAGYFNKKEHFDFKSYYIGKLPDWCKDGKLKISNDDLASILSGKEPDFITDFAYIYKGYEQLFIQWFRMLQKKDLNLSLST